MTRATASGGQQWDPVRTVRGAGGTAGECPEGGEDAVNRGGAPVACFSGAVGGPAAHKGWDINSPASPVPRWTHCHVGLLQTHTGLLHPRDTLIHG